MPKMKTNRAAAKRMRATGSGKIRRSRAGKRHMMRGKSARRLRKLRKHALVATPELHRMRRLLPYEF